MNEIDIAVIVAYLLGMAGMGFWFMRQNGDADAYFKAGGKLPWWVVSLSIYATMFSFITFMKRVNGFGATCGLVANYLVCFGLDQVPFADKPHLLLYGFLGMVACLVVATVASWFNFERKGKR